MILDLLTETETFFCIMEGSSDGVSLFSVFLPFLYLNLGFLIHFPVQAL